MANERRRTREAQQAARRAEVEAAARRREQEARRDALRTRLTPRMPRRRPRRYGALPTLARVQLVVGYLCVQAVAWVFLRGLGQRGAFAVLSLAVFAVLVRTRRRPAR